MTSEAACARAFSAPPSAPLINLHSHVNRSDCLVSRPQRAFARACDVEYTEDSQSIPQCKTRARTCSRELAVYADQAGIAKRLKNQLGHVVDFDVSGIDVGALIVYLTTMCADQTNLESWMYCGLMESLTDAMNGDEEACADLWANANRSLSILLLDSNHPEWQC